MALHKVDRFNTPERRYQHLSFDKSLVTENSYSKIERPEVDATLQSEHRQSVRKKGHRFYNTH